MRFVILLFLTITALGCKKDQAIPLEQLGYVLTFEDEFNGDSLDRSKWNTKFEWGQSEGNTEGLTVDSAISVKDGKLRIRLKKRICYWKCV